MVDRKDLAAVEPIVAQWIRERGTMMDGASYAAALELAAYVSAHRTTPDRDEVIEECAKLIESRAAEIEAAGSHIAGTMGRIYRDEAMKIRALKTAPTISTRDALVEEIADMVDHMGEGRRLEEYVRVIRAMKSGDKGGV